MSLICSSVHIHSSIFTVPSPCTAHHVQFQLPSVLYSQPVALVLCVIALQFYPCTTHCSSIIPVLISIIVLHFQLHLAPIPFSQPQAPLLHMTSFSMLWPLLTRAITLEVKGPCDRVACCHAYYCQ